MRPALLAALSLLAGAVSSQSTVHEEHVLAKADGPDAIAFGASVALSGDRALVVSPRTPLANGCALLYRREGGRWVLDQDLSPALVEGVGGGAALDGDTAVVTGSSLGALPPAVHVFRHAGTAWTEEQVLRVEGPGPSVALDGDRLAVGATGDSDLGASAGAVHVFRRAGSAWTEEAKLFDGTPEDLELFGWVVALDGPVLVAAGFSGAATAFAWDGAAWAREQDLGGPARSADVDGDLVALGLGSDTVRVLRRRGGAWTQEQVLERRGTTTADFGASVAVQAGRIVVGAPDAGAYGSAYLFRRDGARWVPVLRFAASDATHEGFEHPELGTSVALDGADVLAGAPVTGPNESVFGAAYVFEATDLALACTSASPRPGELLELRTSGGLAGAPVALLATGLAGSPRAVVLDAGAFDGAGVRTLTVRVPASLAGLRTRLRSLGYGQPRAAGLSNEVVLLPGD